MNNKYKYILVSLIFLTLILSLSSVSAEDLNTVQKGEVSGGVDVVSSNPGDGNGELTYEIPDDVENLQYAGLFIDTYTAGSSNLVYGSETNVTLISNGESEQIANEQLVASVGSADGEVYHINDHTTKCFADYLMTYNLTEKLQNVSGKITINVTSAPIEGYTYYNKIKLIGLVFAYDGGTGDKVSYWVNAGSAWSKTDDGTTNKAIFKLGTISDEVSDATLDNFALSSVDGIYTFNGEELDESMVVEEGIYYSIYHKFNILNKIKNGTNTLIYTPGEGSYSFRNVLSVLKINRAVDRSVDTFLSSEYSGAVFAGTNNVLKLNLTNAGEARTNYILDLYADNVKVNSSRVKLDVGENSIVYLNDKTIRPITKDTVNGANCDKVNYTVKISDDKGIFISETSIAPTLWYNGNLGKDLAYPSQNITLFKEISVNGGVLIDTLDDSTYLSSSATNRADVWNINLANGEKLVNAFVYVAYNWDKSSSALPVWTTSFNGKSISPVASYRDQSNLGTYGKYGYGLLVYDVSSLAKVGKNTFILNKDANLTAVYPSTFVALYNATGSKTLTTIYMYNGADLLSNANNFLGRLVASNNILDVDIVEGISDAEVHVFAASAQSGEGNLIVNGKEFADVWNGTSNSVDEYVVDLSSTLKQSNNVSFVATGSTILALEQFVIFKSPSYKNSADLQKLINNAKAGSTLNLGNETFANIANVNITKDLTITGGIIRGKEGETIFVVPAKSAGGPNKVNITGVNFKVNNENIVVKAFAENDTNPNLINAPKISIRKNTIDLANDDVVTKSVTVLELDSERGILAPTSEIAVQGNTLASGLNLFEFEVTSAIKKNDLVISPGGNIPAKQSSQIKYGDMKTIAVNQKIEGRAGEYFQVNLTDNNGKPLVDKKVQIGFNGAVYNRTTNETGGVKVQINLGYKGTYTFAVSFLGDDYYNGSFVVAKIDVSTQKTKLSTNPASYKASAKTKTLTATLKDAKGNLISGKKVSFTVNGKSYTATTNAKGVASVKVSLSTKKTYSFTVKYAGDNMYTASSANGKVTIN